MNIYINARFLTQNVTGVQRYATEISKRLKKIKPFIKFIAPKNIIHKELAEELGVEIYGNLTGHLWEQLELPLHLKSKGSPLLINLVNTAPLFYKNKIVTIHDLAFKHFSDAFAKNFIYYYNFLMPRITKNSLSIITVSNFSKDDIVKHYNIPHEKIFVAYNAVSENFKRIESIGKEEDILCVASLQPYKNIERLIKAFLLLKKSSRDVKLVLAGGMNKKVFLKTRIFELIKNKKDIILAGYVDEEKLVGLYNKAMLFVFPSFYEGFGLPPLEAMACGCPVVVSNAASLPEVCGDAAYYVDPFDIESIAEGIHKVLTDEPLRQSLIEKGLERARLFSWERSAKEHIKVFEEVLNSQKGKR